MNIISDIFWEEIRSLIPAKKSKVGRPVHDPRKTLNGILYVVQSGCQWRLLPQQYGKRSTVHGKFMEWARTGVFEKIMNKMVQCYEDKQGRFGIWYAVDASTCKAPFASSWGGKNPTDRAKLGVKKHLIIDQRGAPMAITVGPANMHDSQGFDTVFDRFSQYNPDELKVLAGDSAFDAKRIRSRCKSKKFILLAAPNKRKSKKAISNTGSSHRWLVERTFGWLSWFRGLKTCWAKTKISFLSFCQLACSDQLFRMS